jgi:hypothetical protein
VCPHTREKGETRCVRDKLYYCYGHTPSHARPYPTAVGLTHLRPASPTKPIGPKKVASKGWSGLGRRQAGNGTQASDSESLYIGGDAQLKIWVKATIGDLTDETGSQAAGIKERAGAPQSGRRLGNASKSDVKHTKRRWRTSNEPSTCESSKARHGAAAVGHRGEARRDVVHAAPRATPSRRRGARARSSGFPTTRPADLGTMTRPPYRYVIAGLSDSSVYQRAADRALGGENVHHRRNR